MRAFRKNHPVAWLTILLVIGIPLGQLIRYQTGFRLEEHVAPWVPWVIPPAFFLFLLLWFLYFDRVHGLLYRKYKDQYK